MKKTAYLYFIGWLAVLGLFNTVTFVTPNTINGTSKFDTLFWIAYALITVFFAVQLGVTYYILRSASLQRNFYNKVFYNISLYKISIITLAVMLVIGGLCMAVIQIPDWIGIIICAIVITVNIIAYVRALIPVNAVSAIDDKIKEKTFLIKSLTASAQALMTKVHDEEAKALANKVYEAIRYSDPMSVGELREVEERIKGEFSRFSSTVASGSLEEAKACSDELLYLIEERNVQCKLLK